MKILRVTILTLTWISLALLLVNCEQNSSSTGSGNVIPITTIGSITLTAGSTQLFTVSGIPAVTTITATVTNDSGTAIPSIPVSFNTPLIGSISTTSATTDSLGRVSVTFNSLGQFGNASITASVTSGSVTKTGYITISVFPLTGIAKKITLSLAPNLVYTSTVVEDSIKATVRVFDSLNVGIPGMHVSLSTTKGVVSFPDTTNNTGTTVTWINTNQDTGMGIVTASVYTSLPDTLSSMTWPGLLMQKVLVPGLGLTQGLEPTPPPTTYNIYQISDTDTFWVLPINMQVSNIIVSAYPSVLTVPYDTVRSAVLTTIVRDANNVGLANVPVQLWTNKGLLSTGVTVTGSNGMAIDTFTSVPNDFGISTIFAKVGNIIDTCTINISPTAVQNGRLDLYTSTNLIYADGGITFAQMTALLKDADNQVITGVPIIFTADLGTIASPVLTDSTGQARSNFLGLTLPSAPDSAMVIAKYAPLNLSDTVKVMIAPARAVDHVVLNIGSGSLQANGTDSTRVDATVYLEGNELAPQNTEVNFNIIGSHASEFSASLALVGNNGTATVTFYAGTTTGTDTLFAECDGVLSNMVPLLLHAGPPAFIDIESDTASLFVNSQTTATITATLKDTTGNLVGNNFPVFFGTSLGSITPISAPTANGVATAHLQASTVAGGALVWARYGAISDTTLVTFVATGPANITLSADSAKIYVQGGGSYNYTAIKARVIDASGNPVSTPVWVKFQIIGWSMFPVEQQPNLNNHGLVDSTTTNSGIATVVLNAGTRSGPVQIKASTANPNPPYNLISAQQSLVTITAGPPHTLNIESMSDPQDGGGDTWRLEVSTRAQDINGNPVPDTTSLSFYLVPETIGFIEGNGYTRNTSWNNQSYPGVAYTTLTYHSSETYDSVAIWAWCQVNETIISDSFAYMLPLSNGQLWVQVQPVAWNYSWPPYMPPYQPARMEVTATLKDGHNVPIDNGMINFYSTRGYFYLVQVPQPGTIPVLGEITGPPGLIVDPNGQAHLWLITTLEQAFPVMGATENTAQVYCQVDLFPDITSTSVTVTYTKDE